MSISDATIVDAIEKHGSQRKAAEALGLNRRTVERRMAAIRGTSTLYDKDGNRALTWVKTQRDNGEEKLDAILGAIAESVKPLKPAAYPKAATNPDLLNVYILTDYHLGMLAWGEETGADWDIGIAERNLDAWITEAIARAPKARRAVFAQLGDFLHYDSFKPITPASGHILDADSRFSRMIGVARRALQRIVDKLLRHHEEVIVLQAEGNHDEASSAWLRELFCALYENEPRCTVITRPDPYYCVTHGKTVVFFTHGHKRSFKDCDVTLAAKFRSEFGEAEHCYAHTGHFHHIQRRETALMVVEQHRTLAAPDAYASRGGWMSGRSTDVITYDANRGEVCRITVRPAE